MGEASSKYKKYLDNVYKLIQSEDTQFLLDLAYYITNNETNIKILNVIYIYIYI